MHRRGVPRPRELADVTARGVPPCLAQNGTRDHRSLSPGPLPGRAIAWGCADWHPPDEKTDPRLANHYEKSGTRRHRQWRLQETSHNTQLYGQVGGQADWIRYSDGGKTFTYFRRSHRGEGGRGREKRVRKNTPGQSRKEIRGITRRGKSPINTAIQPSLMKESMNFGKGEKVDWI